MKKFSKLPMISFATGKSFGKDIVNGNIKTMLRDLPGDLRAQNSSPGYGYISNLHFYPFPIKRQSSQKILLSITRIKGSDLFMRVIYPKIIF